MRLRELCTLFTDGDWIESKDQSASGIRLVQTGNIGEGKFLDKAGKEKFISEETFKALKCTEVFPGDVLISRLPDPVGRGCIVPRTEQKMITAVDCTICRVNEDVITRKYFCYYLQSGNYYQQLEQSVTGTTRKRISRKNLGNVEVSVPPIRVQKEITDRLDCLAGVMSAKRQQLDFFGNLIKARFVEMFGVGKYPRVSLIDTIKEGAGLSYGIVVPGDNVEGGIPMVRPSDFKNGNLDLSNVYKVSPDVEIKYAKTRLSGDEVLVQVIGQPGQVILATDDCKGMNVTRNLAVIRPNRAIINRVFLKCYIEKEESQKHLLKSTKQSTLKQLPLSLLKQLEIQLPPIELQEKFSSFVAQVDKSKVAVQKSLDEAQLLFDSLMQKYFG